ncbi:hypothetical protein BpHYR1_027629 [Brachionus plicatilis]|uniref:Uncharacterized protein n=1 Tax=Brachionus plicatilis TaxID=10195 RepID=A0A3M7PH21_BRAPC|nr:hypothetical protein BpHYR1_027629 [Brachionus plicatilis]
MYICTLLAICYAKNDEVKAHTIILFPNPIAIGLDSSFEEIVENSSTIDVFGRIISLFAISLLLIIAIYIYEIGPWSFVVHGIDRVYSLFF